MLLYYYIIYLQKVKFVPRRGLEPPPPKGPAPKASVYTNFTTWAIHPLYLSLCKKKIPQRIEKTVELH
jgi:hypothetical protein